MSTDTKKFTIELTKDELTILHYIVPASDRGDPLKDTYELCEDEPEDPYAALAALRKKLYKLDWATQSASSEAPRCRTCDHTKAAHTDPPRAPAVPSTACMRGTGLGDVCSCPEFEE